MQHATTETELNNLTTLCRSLKLHNNSDDIGNELLKPIASILGAESAAYRHINLEYTRPRILNLTSIGVPNMVADDYQSHFQYLDPYLDNLHLQITNNNKPAFGAGQSIQKNVFQRYSREFLLPNGLVQHAGMVLKDPAKQQAWIFNFHRCASSSDFDALELARANMIELYLQAQVTVSEQVQAINCRLLQQLSPREQEIATAVTKGLSNKQIGLSLLISPRTVENHLHSIYEKLQVSTRTQLMSLLY